jgi:peptidylprolyl isomerase
MSQAKNGDTVKVHYTGKLDDGMVFDSSADREPLEFVIGGGNIIQGFDTALIGMAVGDRKTIEVPPEQGYGERDEKLVADIARSQVPDNMDIQVGAALTVKHDNGQVVNVTVTDMTANHVTLDANHPLAGKTLTFDLKLVAIS